MGVGVGVGVGLFLSLNLLIIICGMKFICQCIFILKEFWHNKSLMGFKILRS